MERLVLEKLDVMIDRLDEIVILLEPQMRSKKAKSDSTDNGLVWHIYSDAYQKRWGVDPVRNAKTNTAIANFVKRIGVIDALEVIRFFVDHNDPLYIKSQHDLSLALRDAESLRTQWARGQQITMKDARDMEHQDHYRKQAKKVMEGKV